MRRPSHAGTRPPWRGRSALPVRLAIVPVRLIRAPVYQRDGTLPGVGKPEPAQRPGVLSTRVQGVVPCRAAKNPNTPTSRNVKPTTSPRAMKKRAWARRKLSGAPGRPSTKTTAAARSPVDREGASTLDTRQLTKVGASAAKLPLQGRQRHVRRLPRRLRQRASVADIERQP
jgi:hypothetical protein